jgi:hypothetical protein
VGADRAVAAGAGAAFSVSGLQAVRWSAGVAGDRVCATPGSVGSTSDSGGGETAARPSVGEAEDSQDLLSRPDRGAAFGVFTKRQQVGQVAGLGITVVLASSDTCSCSVPTRSSLGLSPAASMELPNAAGACRLCRASGRSGHSSSPLDHPCLRANARSARYSLSSLRSATPCSYPSEPNGARRSACASASSSANRADTAPSERSTRFSNSFSISATTASDLE